jgi:hypothetical protein
MPDPHELSPEERMNRIASLAAAIGFAPTQIIEARQVGPARSNGELLPAPPANLLTEQRTRKLS